MNELQASHRDARAHRPLRPSLSTLAYKELLETFRDRRTLVTLILMPLLVYPLLSLGFRSFLASSTLQSTDDPWIRYRIGLSTPVSDRELQSLFGQLEEAYTSGRAVTTDAPQSSPSPSSDTQSPRRIEAPLSAHQWVEATAGRVQALRLLELGEIDLFIELQRDEESGEILWGLTYDPSIPASRNASRLVREHLEVANRLALQRRLREQGHDATVPMAVQHHVASLNLASKSPNLTAIIPLILVLMTITGAVYPAIDLTAGERERGTLETLIAAPIPRMKILFAKMLAVLSVSILTAILNLVGMLGTIWAFQLEATLIGPQGLSWDMVAKILALLVLFAMFFAGVMLVITSYARSFKEAQAYLIPLILLSLGPGLLTLTPGMELAGAWAVTPMINMLLLARDVLQNDVALVPATVAVVSTLIYAGLALALAASIFGSDTILYGGQSSWGELLVRPSRVQSTVVPQAALFCLLLLLPLNFVLIGILSRIETSIAIRLVVMAVFTALAFFAIPTALAIHQRARWTTCFGWLKTHPVYWIIALVIGLTAWPMVMSLVTAWQQVITWLAGEEAARTWAERLVEFSRGHVERFRDAPLVLIAVAFSLVPALCEEWFFRGMLLRSLLPVVRPWTAILFSALAFGAFHTLSGGIAMFDRFLTTAAMGVMLGWIAVRADSIVPGVILHAMHNAIVFGLAYFQPQLAHLPGFPREGDPVPTSWIVASFAIVTLALVVLSRWRRTDRALDRDPSAASS